MKKDNQLVVYCLIVVIIILLFYIGFQLFDKEYEGEIIYRRFSRNYSSSIDNEKIKDYIYHIIDFDRNISQDIGEHRGNLAISNDGKYFAVSCKEDVSKICIYDLDTLENMKEFPRLTFQKITPYRIKEIQLPNACEGLNSPAFGLDSISWNSTDHKIAVVCGAVSRINVLVKPERYGRQLCIIDIQNEESQCWENENIYAAFWSPTKNQLLLTMFSKEIYLMDFDKDREETYITDGIGANWSPDGKKIAYIDDYKIKIRNLRNNNEEIVYETPEEFNENKDLGYLLDFNFDSIINWSPNGKKLIFHAGYRAINARHIIIIDIKSKEVNCMTCGDSEDYYFLSPAWGK